MSRHKRSTDFIILLSSTQICESSWICVSFMKHKIRKTVYPILCRFRKKVSFDLFGWTACWSKSFKADLSSWICEGLAPTENKSTRRNWITTGVRLLAPLLCFVSCKVGEKVAYLVAHIYIFCFNFVGLFDAGGQSQNTVTLFIVLCLVSTVWLWAGLVTGRGFWQIPGTRDCGT